METIKENLLKMALKMEKFSRANNEYGEISEGEFRQKVYERYNSLEALKELYGKECKKNEMIREFSNQKGE